MAGADGGSRKIVLGVSGRKATLPRNAKRAVIAREALRPGGATRYVELIEFEDHLEGTVGWEWYRRHDDVGEYCGRAEVLGCKRVAWHRDWAWCEVETPPDVNWATVGVAVSEARVWELRGLAPETKLRELGREWDAYGEPTVVRGLPLVWLSIIQEGDASAFGVSYMEGHRAGPFDKVIQSVAKAFPFGVLEHPGRLDWRISEG